MIGRRLECACLVLGGLTLAGCGGGSDSTPAAAAPATITVAGTAVQGSALSGAAVTVKCATGSGTTTTAAGGAYASTIEGAVLPCVVKVVGADGTTYHSLVAGTGNTGTYTANVTPLTEMIVALVGATDPAAFFSGFGASSSVPEAGVAAANAYLRMALAGLADLSGINPLTDTLVVGNALDRKIDDIAAGLAAAGITVAEVTASILENPTAPSVVAAPLAASATDCASLKSGTYRFLSRTETDPKYRFGTFAVDATALTAKDADGAVIPLTSDGSCQFSIDSPEETDKVIVSSGGMIVVHEQSKTVTSDRNLSIGVPEQTLPVAEFAGSWNIATWEPGNIGSAGSAAAFNAEVTIDSTGQITGTKGCVGLFPCVEGGPPFAKLVASPAGGFDLVEDGSVAGRVFLYKTVTGRKVALILNDDNQLGIGVPMSPLPAPAAVGTVSTTRSLQINGNNSVSDLSEDSITVTASDSTAKTVTRLRASDRRVDTLTLDQPRDGLRHRVGNSCTIDGAPVACAETVQLPLRGMGITMTLSASPQPTLQFYQLSIDKP